MTNEYEMEILKECFESMEKTLENTEKERDYYQVDLFVVVLFFIADLFLSATLSTDIKRFSTN